MEVEINSEYPEQKVKIGSQLLISKREDLISFLEQNFANFAWTTSDMPEIDTKMAKHKLNIVQTFTPIRQKARTFKDEKEGMKKEVNKLLEVGFIREVQYHTWLANVVLVKKSNGKWRMCLDFTDLNKVCPKDFYLLPRIDALVSIF